MTERTVFGVVQLGKFFATRSLGRDGRDRLDDLVENGKDLDLAIDFTGVEAMTFSFVDELLGRFVSSFNGTTSNATLAVTGLDPENLFAVTVCIERRGAVIAHATDASDLELLGGDDLVGETFAQAVSLGEFTAGELAANLGISAQNANNRLKKLAESGAVRKRRSSGNGRGGKEFVYETVKPLSARQATHAPA
jgi:DNA-binding transcriptional ArsR family regulator